MKIVEDRFKLEMSDWEKRTFGDMNIAHTERFNEIGYPNPSAPSVFLLYRAEKFMAENYMMPEIPFDMEITLTLIHITPCRRYSLSRSPW